MYAKETRKGSYMPVNLEKYIGVSLPLTYRSSWELTAFKFFDNNPNVIFWSSESIQIAYLKPVQNAVTGRVGYKKSTYYPDIYVEYVNRHGDYKKELLEIKPKKFTKPTRAKKIKTRLNETYALAVNKAKWQAAENWCAMKGDVTFKILTEQSLFGG